MIDNLSEKFTQVIRNMGMKKLENPIFYHAPIGIRFEIGNPVIETTLKNNETNETNEIIRNKKYFDEAYKRAKSIYQALPDRFDILRFDCYPNKNNHQKLIKNFCRITSLSEPDEQKISSISEDKSIFYKMQLYWDLKQKTFDIDNLLKKIICADFGGYQELCSSIFFMDTKNSVMFHLYDDRGADLIASHHKVLQLIFEQFYDWILEFDKERINAIFTK